MGIGYLFLSFFDQWDWYCLRGKMLYRRGMQLMSFGAQLRLLTPWRRAAEYTQVRNNV